jgi:tetratricopeptide (TPR) repeat protein
MKKSILILVVNLMWMGVVVAQETTAPKSELPENLRQRNESDQRIYEMAMRYNDVSVAKMKLYDLMERNPRNPKFAELLSSIYFEMEQYSSSALLAMDMLERDSKNITALEIAAYSLEQIGALERALPYFESLHLLTGDMFSLYKTSYLQYSLKKYEEALNSVNMLIKDKKAVDQTLSFPTDGNNTQEIAMVAAALNLKGLIYKDQGSNTEAKLAFEEALAKSPEFELAKKNVAEL